MNNRKLVNYFQNSAGYPANLEPPYIKVSEKAKKHNIAAKFSRLSREVFVLCISMGLLGFHVVAHATEDSGTTLVLTASPKIKFMHGSKATPRTRVDLVISNTYGPAKQCETFDVKLTGQLYINTHTVSALGTTIEEPIIISPEYIPPIKFSIVAGQLAQFYIEPTTNNKETVILNAEISCTATQQVQAILYSTRIFKGISLFFSALVLDETGEVKTQTGNQVAHIDLMIGPRGSADGRL